jgi:hypothetical protein
MFNFAKVSIIEASFGGCDWAEPLPKYGTTHKHPQSAFSTCLLNTVWRHGWRCSKVCSMGGKSPSLTALTAWMVVSARPAAHSRARDFALYSKSVSPSHVLTTLLLFPHEFDMVIRM